MNIEDAIVGLLAGTTLLFALEAITAWRCAKRFQEGWEKSIWQREADLEEFKAFHKQVRYLSKEFGVPEETK